MCKLIIKSLFNTTTRTGIFVICALLLTHRAQALDFTFCVSGDSPLNTYSEQLLNLALNEHGNHTITKLTHPNLSYQRMVRQAGKETSPCSVIIVSSENKQGAPGLKMVPVPLTEGLMGARVLIYKDKIKPKWHEAKSLESLKANYTIGSGAAWQSSRLLKNAGFKVAPAYNLDSLWRMFNKCRFDLMHRGVAEVYREKLQRSDAKNHFHIDTKFPFVYKADIFFYIREEDALRYNILSSALNQIHLNGTHHQFVLENFFGKSQIKKHDFINRETLFLKDSDRDSLPIEISHIQDEFWFDRLLVANKKQDISAETTDIN